MSIVSIVTDLGRKYGFTTKTLYSKYNDALAIDNNISSESYGRAVRKVCRIYSPDQQNKSYDQTDRSDITYAPISVDSTPLPVINPSNEYSNSYKRIVVLSDMHCGHNLGLTPEVYQYKLDNPTFYKQAHLQRELWNWYKKDIQTMGKKCDYLVVNGDAIDGDAKKNNGVELISTDRSVQAAIAAECINEWEYEKLFIVAGTGYHTGSAEDWESYLADQLGGHFKENLFLEVNNVRFNFVHHISTGRVEQNRVSAALRSALFQEMESYRRGYDAPDFIVRSHAHIYTYGELASVRAMITPALQINSSYGVRRCEGHTDLGYVIIDVYEDGRIVMTPRLVKMTNSIVKYEA
jgi:hypothetical protein